MSHFFVSLHSEINHKLTYETLFLDGSLGLVAGLHDVKPYLICSKDEANGEIVFFARKKMTLKRRIMRLLKKKDGI